MVDQQEVQVEGGTLQGTSLVMAQHAGTVKRPSQLIGPDKFFFFPISQVKCSFYVLSKLHFVARNI